MRTKALMTPRKTATRPARPAPSIAKTPIPDLPGDLVTGATVGDHLPIYDFLQKVFRNPSRDHYLASLDDPLYEPADRLLIKRDDRIVAHAHITKRLMRFALASIPVSGINSIGVSPEYHGHGYGMAVLRAAERRMQQEGALIGLLRTGIPHFFRAAGWAVCGRHCYSRAGARDVLAQLVSLRERASVRNGLADPRRADRKGLPGSIAQLDHDVDPHAALRPLRVRPWRQVELPALMRLFSDASQSASGAIERNEAYWRWLISRKGFDQILVAVDGPDRGDWQSEVSPIVGYVVLRDEHVLELVARKHPRAAIDLLAHACGEAIERDYHAIWFHAAPSDPMHQVMRIAGGEIYHHLAHADELFMVKLLQPVKFLRAIADELVDRAEAVGLPRNWELGLNLPAEKLCLRLSRRHVRVLPGRVGRSYLSLNEAEFTRLLMGHIDFQEAVADNRIIPSTRVAHEIGASLFPQLPLWRSPLDDAAL